jgi:amino acid transporter
MDVNFKWLNFYGVFCFLIITLFFSFFTVAQAVEGANPPAKKGISDWNTQLNGGAGKTGIYQQVDTATTEKVNAYERLIAYLGGILNLTLALGLILMARLLWAGYNWMTAGGNTEQVEMAKKTILHATIGVILMITLYVIAFFVIDRIKFITGYTN